MDTVEEKSRGPALGQYRSDLPPIPPRMLGLPVVRGYPVPWFVDKNPETDEYDFRIADTRKILRAVREHRCWICGETLGRRLVFVAGPMCAVNRISSEPPSHRECADFSARACPFLILKEAERRAFPTDDEPGVREGLPEGLPEEVARELLPATGPPGSTPAAGLGLKRQPGVVMLWITESFNLFPTQGGVLFRMGEPLETVWYHRARPATRAEVMESIESGLPILRRTAEIDGPKAVAAIEAGLEKALALVPEE